MKSILVIAAHPDDEVLGCGGAIAKHVSQGDEVNLVIMSDGVKSRTKYSNEELKNRLDSTKSSQVILGISKTFLLDFPDNKMDTIPLLKIIKELELIIERIRPSVIYTHHFGDLNIDHQITFSAVMTAARPLPNSSVKEIFGFEVLSSTDFLPNNKTSFRPTYFIDISRFFKIKTRALKAYGFEMRDPPHSRSIQHVEIMAKHRGFCVGIDFAEAFEVYRVIK